MCCPSTAAAPRPSTMAAAMPIAAATMAAAMPIAAATTAAAMPIAACEPPAAPLQEAAAAVCVARSWRLGCGRERNPVVA